MNIMTYRVPKYNLFYDTDTLRWICSTDELPMSAYAEFPQAAIASFHILFQNICHKPNELELEDLEKLRVL